MRAAIVALLVLVVPHLASAIEPTRDDLDRQFRDVVTPLLKTYCVDCHGSIEPESDLDLSDFNSLESLSNESQRWGLVLDRLEEGTMPPEDAEPRPSDELRRIAIESIQRARRFEALRHAGDPGPVLPRRLSNAEYDYTIHDLTGVDIRPTKEFPVDPASEAGFDNTGESLAMSPALVKKYLEAAWQVANHLVLTPDDLAFAPHPVIAETDRDKYCVNRIIEFYRRQPTAYTDYFFAAWTFKNREKTQITLDEVAQTRKVSRKYLKTIWDTLEGPAEEVGPIAALQVMWRTLPNDLTEQKEARRGCERMRDFVVELRDQVKAEFPNLTIDGVNRGSQPLVLWKDRQYATHRRSYGGGALEIDLKQLDLEGAAAKTLEVPSDEEARWKFESTFERFCSIFPDTFLVSERARVFLDPEVDKNNVGRLLSAGFHSQMGYFRDDQPLYDLILDEEEQRELDRLWQELDFIAKAPIRQHQGFIWFERAESRFLRDPEFDFARAEDKASAEEANIRKLAEVYLAKIRRSTEDEVAIQAVEDHFQQINASIRRVERAEKAAEPKHLTALQRIAERAYRRPLSEEEANGITNFYQVLREEDGLGHDGAVRGTFVSILMSPHFSYRIDVPSAGEGIQPVSDYTLASRLSYFLWSSMPDEELLAHAAAGDLHKPDILLAQTRRMLRDERIRRFATEFGGNWLDIRRFEEWNSVDRDRFPEFTDELRRAMFEEPIRFLAALVQNDGPVLDLLSADYTFVNPVLARHYGIGSVDGEANDWVRVEDASRFGRGGLLPMAAFLTKNAPGLRTSPVKRGFWVVRRLLGESIPAPPPNVPELPKDEASLGNLTLPEALAKHRDNKACASCHVRFDSVGLAFEGYGPVGELRTLDLGGRPVQNEAVFPDETTGVGLAGLKEYLRREREDDFRDTLCRKLMSYALGRSLILSDELTIETMRSELEKNDDRVSSLIETIVTSPQFLNQRGRDVQLTEREK